jgi:tetratricopeptide (TPR) repeat protein
LLGRPLSGISVEVRNIKTHSTITSAISGPNGAVVFYGLPPGRYEVTVAGGLLPPRREMLVDAGDSQTVLELPLSQLHAGETVSVRQLTIPHNAIEALDAATDAWQKQQWKKARVQATQALLLYPGYGAALALLGFLDLQAGDLEQACANLKRAIESDPNSALAYVALGSAYNSMKRYEAALEALSVFPSVSADSWQVHYEQARAFIGLREYELGLREIDSSQQLAKQDPAVLRLGKAHALLGLHRNSEAAAELETIVRNQPNGPYTSDAQSLLAALRSQKQH